MSASSAHSTSIYEKDPKVALEVLSTSYTVFLARCAFIVLSAEDPEHTAFWRLMGQYVSSDDQSSVPSRRVCENALTDR